MQESHQAENSRKRFIGGSTVWRDESRDLLPGSDSGELGKGPCLYRISEGVELLRAEISRVTICGVSSPSLAVLRDW